MAMRSTYVPRGGQEGPLGAAERPTYVKPTCNGSRGASGGPPLDGPETDRHGVTGLEGPLGDPLWADPEPTDMACDRKRDRGGQVALAADRLRVQHRAAAASATCAVGQLRGTETRQAIRNVSSAR